MRVVYYLRSMTISGGAKVLTQHVRLLRKRGVDADLLTLRNEFPGFFDPAPVVISGPSDPRLHADSCVVTKPSDVPWIFEALGRTQTLICHLCQGDEITDLRSRIQHVRRAQKLGIFPLAGLAQMLKFRRRLKRYEQCYSLPSHKLAVSSHLCRLIEERFRQECFEIANGVDLSVFRTISSHSSANQPWRLVSIGSCQAPVKGIEYVLCAVAILKQAGYPVRFTRISSGPMTDVEKDSGVVDAYVHAIPESEVSRILRQSHVLVAGSQEAEGFGLPALEAMACGVPCVLTKVPCYLGFSSQWNFAHFVAPRQPQEVADGVIALMTDGAYRSGIIQHGIEVAQRYALDRVGDKLVLFFANLCKERTPAGGDNAAPMRRIPIQ